MPERTTERHRAGQPRRPRAFRLRVGHGGHTGAGQSEANSDGVSYATNTAAHRHCPHPKPVEVCGGAEHGAPPFRVTARAWPPRPNGAGKLSLTGSRHRRPSLRVQNWRCVLKPALCAAGRDNSAPVDALRGDLLRLARGQGDELTLSRAHPHAHGADTERSVAAVRFDGTSPRARG